MVSSNITRRAALLVAVVAVLTFDSSRVAAQTAQVQIIHNAPDPALRWLDIYLDDALVKDSLLFRIATPYIEVPAGDQIQAGLAPLNSTGPQDVFKTIPIALEEGGQYILVVNGVFDPASFKPNPDGLSTEVSILVAETKSDAEVDGTSEYLFINGVTDAPALDFVPGDAPALGSDLAFGSVSEYQTLDEFVYTMALSPTDAPSLFYAFYDLDVGFLQNRAFTVLASGFLDKFENGVGPEMKLFIVSPSGFFRAIDPAAIPDELATIQFINNSADVPHMIGFDILLDGGRALDNLRFRKATPTYGLRTDINVQIQVADSSGSDVFANSVLSTEAGRNYLAMISGLVTPADYKPNPDGRPTALSVVINPNIRKVPDELGVGEFVFSHGITDAPSANLRISGLEPIRDLRLGDMTGYYTLSDFEPLMELFRADSPLPALISHIVSIPFILGKSFVMFSSGFDDVAQNQGGSPAQLTLALKDGAVVELRAREILWPLSKLQLIHASPDPSIRNVDLYINEFRVVDDAEFRSGTRFFDVYSGKTTTLGVAPAGSPDFRSIVTSFRVQFDSSTTFAGIFGGVLDPGSFAPNPDGRDTEIGIQIVPDALEDGPDATQLTVLVANTVTDSPLLDVVLDDAVLFADNLGFSDAGSYGVVGVGPHNFDFRNSATNSRLAKSFVDFSGLPGRAGILVAAGFVDSTGANQNGPPFSTFLVLDDGTTRLFDEIFTSVEDADDTLPTEVAIRSAYPNPFSTSASIVFDLPEAATVSLDLFDVTGRRVARVEPKLLTAGRERTIRLDAPGLSSGMYFYRLSAVAASGPASVQGELMVIR